MLVINIGWITIGIALHKLITNVFALHRPVTISIAYTG